MAERKPIVTVGGQLQELPAGDTTPGQVPPGGATGQVLAKASGTDGDVAWSTPAAGAADNGLCLLVSTRQFLP